MFKRLSLILVLSLVIVGAIWFVWPEDGPQAEAQATDVTVSASGTQRLSLGVEEQLGGNHLGAVFVFTATSTQTVKSFKIQETGTIAATTFNLGIHAHLGFDTTPPFDCVGVNILDDQSSIFGGWPSFDASNESITFSDVFVAPWDPNTVTNYPAPVIGPQKALCVGVYPYVYGGKAGETIEFQISNPSTDVTLAGSTVGPTTPVALPGTTTVTAGVMQVWPLWFKRGEVGIFYDHTQVSPYNPRGGTPPYRWTLASGALPPGLSLAAATSIVSGTPTAGGTYNFSLTVTDSSTPPTTATQAATLIIIGSAWPALAATPGSVGVGGKLIYPGAGDCLYALRGNDTGDFWCYQLSTGTWQAKASVPAPLSNGSLAFFPGNSSFYAFGSDTKFWRYNLATNSWVEKKALPGPPGSGGSLVYPGNGQYLYALAGGYSNGFARYDAVNDVWEIKTSIFPDNSIFGVGPGSSMVANGGDFIYAFSGNWSSQFLRYSIPGDQWISLTAAPANVGWGASLALLGNSIYALQGSGTTAVWRYDLAAANWSSLADNLPAAIREGGSIVAVGSQLYVLGGGSTTGFWRHQLGLVGLSVMTKSLLKGFGGVAYTSTLAAGGGAALYSWSISAGSLPPGLSLNAASGVISGTATTAGNYNFTVTVTDGAAPANSVAKALALSITVPLSVTTATLPNGSTTAAYNQTLAASGGTAPYSWSITGGSLPAGLNLNPATGAITGTPSAPGTYNFSVKVSDSSVPADSGVRDLNITVAATEPLAGTWGSLVNVPAAVRQGGSLVSAGDYIYALSGNARVDYYDTTPTNRFWRYNRVTGGNWQEMAAVLADINNGSLAHHPASNAIFAFGNSTKFWRYDLAANVWAQKAIMPFTPQFGARLAYPGAGNYLYASEGQKTYSYGSSRLARYNINTDSWESLADAPGVDGLTYFAAPAAGGDYFYALEKLPTYATTTNNLYRYNVKANAWSDIGKTPAKLGNGATLTIAGKDLYALQGSTAFWRFDLATGQWTSTLSPAPGNVEMGAALLYPGTGEYIYALAGDRSTSFWRYRLSGPVTALPPSDWETLTSAPETNIDGSLVYYPATNSAYIFGSGSNFWRYDLATGNWEAKAATPSVRSSGPSLAYPGSGKYIYASKGGNSNNLWRYDVDTNTWEVMANLPFFIISQYAGVNPYTTLIADGGGNLYLAGSDAGGSNMFFKYNIVGNAWTTLAKTPDDLGWGSALAVVANDVYALKGTNYLARKGAAGYNPAAFWRFAGNQWDTTSLPDTPGDVSRGGDLVYTGGDYLYALRGGARPDFWRYSLVSKSWEAAGYAPANADLGSRLHYPGRGGYIYGLIGGFNKAVARYRVPVAVVTASLAGATKDLAYNQTLAVSGGIGPLSWSISAGSLPAGLSLNTSTGVISGTPTTAGTASFTVQVKDSGTPVGSSSRALSITVVTAPLNITTTSLPDAPNGVAYNQTLAVIGGTAPFTWSVVSGALPAGLSLNASTGVISETPTTAGTANFTVKVADSSAVVGVANKTFSITVPAAVTVLTPAVTAVGGALVANAGPNQVVVSGNPVILDGSGSTGAVTYDWYLGLPGAAKLIVPSGQRIQLGTGAANSEITTGINTITLVVNDGPTAAQDTITVTVVAVTAAAGGQKTVLYTAEAVDTLDGKQKITLFWEKLGGFRGFYKIYKVPSPYEVVPPGNYQFLAGTSNNNYPFKDTEALSNSSPQDFHTFIVAVPITPTPTTTAANALPNAICTVNTIRELINTPINFSAVYSSDQQDSLDQLKVQWDFNGDGTFDTDPTFDKIAPHPFTIPGTDPVIYRAKLQVMDTAGGTEIADCPAVTVRKNQRPTADAGTDQVVFALDPIILNGSGSDPDVGDQLTYSWVNNFNGEPYTGEQWNIGLGIGFIGTVKAYEFALTVSDGMDSDTDTVLITQLQSPLPPTDRCDAGTLSNNDDTCTWRSDCSPDPQCPLSIDSPYINHYWDNNGLIREACSSTTTDQVTKSTGALNLFNCYYTSYLESCAEAGGLCQQGGALMIPGSCTINYADRIPDYYSYSYKTTFTYQSCGSCPYQLPCNYDKLNPVDTGIACKENTATTTTQKITYNFIGTCSFSYPRITKTVINTANPNHATAGQRITITVDSDNINPNDDPYLYVSGYAGIFPSLLVPAAPHPINAAKTNYNFSYDIPAAWRGQTIALYFQVISSKNGKSKIKGDYVIVSP